MNSAISYRIRKPSAAMTRLLLTLPLLLGACSSSGGGDCATIGMTHEGAVSALTPDGPFSAACVTVAPVGRQTTITAVGSTSILDGVQPRTLTIGFDGDAPGTYRYGGTPPPLSGSYTASSTDATAPFLAGEESVVIVEEVSPRLKGTFTLAERTGRGGRPAISGRFDIER